MTGASTDPSARLPPDPTFSPEAYVSVSRILRGGVIAFVILATGGMIAELWLHPGYTLSSILSTPQSYGPDRLAAFYARLIAGSPTAFITLGVFAMIIVVVGRVVFVAYHAFHGHERPLAYIATVVVLLLLLGLFVIGAIVA